MAVSSHPEAIRSREWVRNNPEKHRANQRRFKDKRRALLDELKSGPCADCGNTFPPCVMDFHHLDPDSKGAKCLNTRGIAFILEEVKKCVLLCANCHRIREYA